MSRNSIRVLSLLFFNIILIAFRVDCLSEYCSPIDRNELLNKLENCTNLKNITYEMGSLSSSPLQPLSFSIVGGGGSASTDSSNGQPMSSSTSSSASMMSSTASMQKTAKTTTVSSAYTELASIKEKYDLILVTLDKVLNAIYEGNSTRNDTIHLFLDILNLVNLVNSHSKLQYCIVSICSLFKNCEFPIYIDYHNFENDAMVAARIASLLTAITFNEKIENKVYLTKKNIYSIIRLALVENDNIYDAKIAFFRSSDQERVIVHANKDLKNNIIEIKDFQQIVEDSKNFQWYNKWTSEKKLQNYTTKHWIYKIDDLKKSLDPNQIKSYNQLIYPNTLDLNSNRFVTNITYDCLIGVWNKVVSVPFLFPNGDIRGVVSVSISLNNFDLKQCGDDGYDENRSDTRFRDPFYGTDKCENESTRCVNLNGKGFVLNSYVCECRRGYYRPKNNSLKYKGKEFHKFFCEKCSDGCDECDDDKPCKTELPLSFKRTALIINLMCIVVCLVLVFLTWYYMTLKILKTSSPRMLFIVLFGAIVSYSEIIPMYFDPSTLTCTMAQILQLEGFLLAYGGLVLKTWRECKLFYVRSVKTIKITDESLMKRLGIIMLIGTAYLIVWAAKKERPQAELTYDSEGLKYMTCKITEWNFASMAIQLAILLWGAVLSIQVRRASIAFKETKLVTWAIFNEGVVLCFVIALSVILVNTKVSCYVPFTLSFVRIHLTITVMLLLLFSYKIYTVILARKKPLQASQQASGILNSFSVSGKDGEQKSSTINEETDKERELRVEIQRLYRQIEEMRSLSMRIANPHLIPKKPRFGYQTKKSKIHKSKNLASENEISKIMSTHDAELQSLIISESQQPVKPKKLIPIDPDQPSKVKSK